MRMGQYKSAVSCYNHAVNLDPTNPMTYNNRGGCKTLLKHNQLKDEMEREKGLRKMSMLAVALLTITMILVYSKNISETKEEEEEK